MKTKLITAIASTLVALSAQCVTVTNTVTIVSNVYNRIAREYYITNNIIQDINYNYNDFTTNTTVNYDVSQAAVAEARAKAQSATNSALAASRSASAAAGSASSAASQYDRVVSAGRSWTATIEDRAAGGVVQIQSTGNSMLTSIRNEKSWFDEHFGQMVTNVNIYHAEDETARQMAQDASESASEAQRAASLANIKANEAHLTAQQANEYTTAVSNKLENGVSEAKQGVSDLFDYTTAVSNKLEHGIENATSIARSASDKADYNDGRITALKGRVSNVELGVRDNHRDITNSVNYTTAVSNKLENGVAEAKQGVSDLFDYTTAVSNKLEHGIENATNIAKSASDKADDNDGRITALNGRVSNVELGVRDNHRDITNSVNYTTAVSNRLENGISDSLSYTTAVSNRLESGVAEAKQGVSDLFDYTTAVSNKLERGVSEAIRGVQNSIEYTTGVSNKLEKMNRIYNDGTGYSMWMDKIPTIQTLRVYRSNYLLVTVTFDPSKYVDNVSGGSFEYTDFTRTPTSLAPHVTPSDFRLYKMKSNNRFLMTDRYNVSSTSTMSYTIYWNAGSSDPADVGSGNGTSGSSGISGTSSKEAFEQTPYHVMSDLTIRKIDNTIIAKLATSIALNAISNWVEQTFQRK